MADISRNIGQGKPSKKNPILVTMSLSRGEGVPKFAVTFSKKAFSEGYIWVFWKQMHLGVRNITLVLLIMLKPQ